MILRLAAIVVVVLGIAGCGGGATSTAPTTTSSGLSPAGRWSGSVSDAVSGEGTTQLALIQQAPNSLTGT